MIAHGLVHRRDMLRIGAVSIAGALASDSLRSAQSVASARSVILLWLAGGVTHIDSFDPKPDAPEEIRGTLQSIATDIPGIRFCETLPCLARQVQHLAVIRSYGHDSNDHFQSQ